MKKIQWIDSVSDGYSHNEISDEEYEKKLVDDYNKSVGNLTGYDCDKCKNKGNYRFIDDKGYTIQVNCDKCTPIRKSMELMNKSGMNNLLNHKVNEFIDKEEFQKDMKSLAVRYVLNNCRDWFVLLGKSGCGKTHLCSSVANTLIHKGLEVIYISWTNLLANLKDNLNESNSIISKYQKVEVLYIDDLFKGNVTKYSKDVAYEIINYRYNNDLTTLISSEMSINELINVDEAIAGRIKEKANEYILYVSGIEKNYRFKKEK